MKKLTIAIVICIMLVGAVQAKVNLPKAEKIKLDNGLTVEVIERHALPLFSLQLTFRAGSIYDPAGKEGLAGLTNEMFMRGTPTRTAKQIAEEIAFGGGNLSNYCGRSGAGFQGEFLSQYGEKGLEILADMLTNSSFSPDEFEKIKTRTLAGLASKAEDPGSLADDIIFTELLGESRYSHSTDGTAEAVSGLTGEDVAGFVDNFYSPRNCVLIISGNVDRKTVKSWLNKYFGKWKGSSKADPISKPFSDLPGKNVLMLDKDDATQTQIRIGNEGIPLDHPDYYALEVARTIYGGSFTSRLVNEIRVNRGLSYGVRCRSNRYHPGGMFYVSTFTKNESVSEVLDIILGESQRMQTEAVPDSELVGAINYRSGLYPLNFETNDDIVGTFANMWLLGHSKSYYENYQENVRKVTSAQIMEVARKYFPKDNYRVVLVGKASEVQAQAEKYGSVTARSISAN